MSSSVVRRCAIYTRKSSENGLEQSFNSLHAQREACEAYIKSQAHEGWKLRSTQYDDGGISGGHVDRPALKALLHDIRAGLIDVIVVYKVDRLSRSLADFVQLVHLFEKHDVSFVSITQNFNTSSSMGRLTLNVLLSFAQFEREVTSERIRDKFAASKCKGMWMGGNVPLGYDVRDKHMIINVSEAETVRHIYSRYLELGSVRRLKEELGKQQYVSKLRLNGKGGRDFSRGALYMLLRNPLYIGKVRHKHKVYDGAHEGIIDIQTWEETQAQLDANKAKDNQRSKAKAPALLAGLLFDDRGNHLSPTHTTKGNRRYRYYVNQALLKFEEGESVHVKRVPAADIEGKVVEQITEFLREPEEVSKLYLENTKQPANQRLLRERCNKLAETWHDGTAQELILRLKQIVNRIELGAAELSIHLNPAGMRRLLNPSGPSDEIEYLNSGALILKTPIHRQSCGMEVKLIIGEKDNQCSHPDSVRAIQKAVQKALEWSNALLTGKSRTLTEIAEKEGVSQRYLSSLIHLSFLAPTVIDHIAKGNVPPGLSLQKLKSGFSLDWKKQSQELGF